MRWFKRQKHLYKWEHHFGMFDEFHLELERYTIKVCEANPVKILMKFKFIFKFKKIK